MKNGKIDKYLFEGGYAQATSTGAYTDSFAFNYYNQDHLGNNREVVDASGSIVQVTNYYPFGTPYADASASQNPNRQQYKYNGKELDTMHGLNTYDYGARQNYPILCRWDRIDPLCEKYYNVSPYNYCMNNPVMRIDPDGRDNFRLNRDGNIDLIEETADDYNLIYSVDKNGICNLNNPFVASSSFFANTTSTTLKGKASEEFGGGVCEYNVTIYSNTNNTESANFFEFASNNTDVEWSYVETSSYSSVGTSHSQGDDVSNAYMMYNAARNNIPVIRNIHSHSLGNNIPSYGDIYFAKQYSQQPLNAPDAQFYIYDRAGYHSYDKNSSVMPPEIVITGSRRKQK